MVTKYSATVTRAVDIRYELEKALYIARSGRPGPVFLDICDDVQRQEIDPASLRSFSPDRAPTGKAKMPIWIRAIEKDVDLLATAERRFCLVGFVLRAQRGNHPAGGGARRAGGSWGARI